MTRWNVGDRVTRQIYMDDGTWDREGDTCLERSPLWHGEVTAIETDEIILMYRVLWDNGRSLRYFGYGIYAEERVKMKTDKATTDLLVAVLKSLYENDPVTPVLLRTLADRLDSGHQPSVGLAAYKACNSMDRMNVQYWGPDCIGG